jgi:hypothetical protein
MKIFALLLMTTLPLFAACEKQGPLERAGKAVDNAVQDTGKGAQSAGKKVDDAVDDVRDGVKDAADDLKNK